MTIPGHDGATIDNAVDTYRRLNRSPVVEHYERVARARAIDREVRRLLADTDTTSLAEADERAARAYGRGYEDATALQGPGARIRAAYASSAAWHTGTRGRIARAERERYAAQRATRRRMHTVMRTAAARQEEVLRTAGAALARLLAARELTDHLKDA
jgi:hypothetical protein